MLLAVEGERWKVGRGREKRRAVSPCIVPPAAGFLSLSNTKKNTGVRLVSGSSKAARGQPTVVRCRMSNACVRRSIFTAMDPAGSHFYCESYGPARQRNFLHLLRDVLHFATSGRPSNCPLCILERAVRGGSQRNRRVGQLQPSPDGSNGALRGTGWGGWQSGSS